MANKVGPKGQVVISKPTRDRLGIQPGWVALETVVGDHVELRFVPPPHDRSLQGSLAGSIRRVPSSLSQARETAWVRAARRKDRGSRE